MQNKLKILVAYHKKSVLLNNDIFVPIHLGRTVAQQKSKDGIISNNELNWLQQNMIGDDTDDNISSLNRYLCENTALYWAWKNYDKIGNPNYIGLMHYRRHLFFDLNKATRKNFHKISNCYHFEHFYDLYNDDGYKYLNKYIPEIEKYDIIGNQIKLKHSVTQEMINISKNTGLNLDFKIFNIVIDRIKETKKDYIEAVDFNLNNNIHYWYNCFIMKKDLFFEYTQFLFDILLYVNKEIDYSKYPINEQRVLAYISERLLGFFITKKTIFENKTIKYVPLAFINNPDLYNRTFVQKIILSFKKFILNCKKFIYISKKIKNVQDMKNFFVRIYNYLIYGMWK